MGETLNKPSRALWGSLNYLAGGDSGGGLLNLVPFSDAAGLTNPRKGVEAADFLENQGALPANTHGFDWFDPVRFGANVGGDPLSWVSGVGLLKGLGKGGSVLSKADKGVKGLSRVGRMTTTVSQAASKIAPDALQNAATRSGFNSAADFLSRHGDEAVGGLMSLNKGPLGGPIKALGTGKLAQTIGGGLDKLGEAARYSLPGRQMARLFDSDALGLHTAGVSKRASELDLPGKRSEIATGHRMQTAKDVTELARHGALDDETSTFGRAYAEDVAPDISTLSPEQQAKFKVAAKLTDPWKAKLDKSYQRARGIGMRVERGGDAAGSYWPRFFIDKLQNSANTMSREDHLVNYEGMTEQLRKAINDPKITEGEFDDAVDYALQGYPTVVDTPKAEFVRDAQGSVIGSQIDPAKWEQAVAKAQQNAEDLVHHIRQVYTKEQRAGGGYARNWLVDVQEAQIGMDWKATRGEAGLDYLADKALHPGKITAQGETRTVAETLDAMGLEPHATLSRPHPVSGQMEEVKAGALRYIADKLDITPTDKNLADLAARRLSVQESDDLVRLTKGDDIKTTVGPVIKMIDSFTNAFKVGVLSWPSRHVRDFTSGQLMSAVTGNWSQKAFADAERMIAGGTTDFTDIPIVQQMLGEQGLEATAENSTEVMRQLIYAHDVFTGMHGSRGAGEFGGVAVLGQTADLQREFVGKDPLSIRRPQTLLGGSTMHPLKLRGVGDNLRTENRIAATSERAGKLSDGMNRLVPFVTNLRRGVDPAQAKQIVDAIQVNYSPSSFTAAERKYLKRLFPFYSYQRKISETVAKELLDRPGGGLGQTIRAQNEFQSDENGPMPEHIAKGLAIPLGETSTGDKSYLTGFGLMHDPAINALGFENGAPSLSATTRNVLAMGNPYAKGLAELGFGKTLFQNRNLEDSDPTLGRLVSNVSDLAGFGKRELPSGRAKPFISTTVEHALANSPASRLLSTLRVATDKRKWEGGPFPGSLAAMNLLTGLNASQVSPGAQEAVLRDALAAMSKREGASEFTNVRFSKADIAEAQKSSPELAKRMVALNRAANELVQRAKRRKQAAKK